MEEWWRQYLETCRGSPNLPSFHQYLEIRDFLQSENRLPAPISLPRSILKSSSSSQANSKNVRFPEEMQEGAFTLMLSPESLNQGRATREENERRCELRKLRVDERQAALSNMRYKGMNRIFKSDYVDFTEDNDDPDDRELLTSASVWDDFSTYDDPDDEENEELGNTTVWKDFREYNSRDDDQDDGSGAALPPLAMGPALY